MHHPAICTCCSPATTILPQPSLLIAITGFPWYADAKKGAKNSIAGFGRCDRVSDNTYDGLEESGGNVRRRNSRATSGFDISSTLIAGADLGQRWSFPIHSWVDLPPVCSHPSFWGLGIRLFLLLCLISFNPWMEEVSSLNNVMSGSRRCTIVEGDVKGRVASLRHFFNKWSFPINLQPLPTETSENAGEVINAQLALCDGLSAR